MLLRLLTFSAPAPETKAAVHLAIVYFISTRTQISLKFVSPMTICFYGIQLYSLLLPDGGFISDVGFEAFDWRHIHSDDAIVNVNVRAGEGRDQLTG